MTCYLATMTTPINTIHHLSIRAASILCEWANLNPLRKNDNGSPGTRGITAILGAMADRGEALPGDAHGRLTAAISERLAALSKARDGIYFTLVVDYHPGRELADLAAAAGLGGVSWPIKSRLRITSRFSDGSGDEAVSETQGYRAPSTTYKLISEDRGWLVTRNFTVDNKIVDLCLGAAKSGHPALKWEPLSDAP